MSKITVTGVWDMIEIYCALHSDCGEQMHIVQNPERFSAAFYVCPEQETAHCANRMNIDDFTGIVDKISEKIAEDPFINLTGYKFRFRGKRQSLNVEILKHSESKIKVAVKNTTVLGG